MSKNYLFELLPVGVLYYHVHQQENLWATAPNPEADCSSVIGSPKWSCEMSNFRDENCFSVICILTYNPKDYWINSVIRTLLQCKGKKIQRNTVKRSIRQFFMICAPVENHPRETNSIRIKGRFLSVPSPLYLHFILLFFKWYPWCLERFSWIEKCYFHWFLIQIVTCILSRASNYCLQQLVSLKYWKFS